MVLEKVRSKSQRLIKSGNGSLLLRCNTFPKHEACCKSSAERNEVLHISLTPSVQLFLLSIEGLFTSASLPQQEPTGVCKMPPAAPQVPVKSCALLSSRFVKGFAGWNGLKEKTRYCSVLGELQDLYAQVPLVTC